MQEHKPPMDWLHRRPRTAVVLSTLIAGGVVVAIGAAERPGKLFRTLAHVRPIWLLPAFGAELLAYAGYVIAYRALTQAPGSRPLSLKLTIQLVVAGFGPSVALGGFALDRRALRSLHHSRRRARLQVMGLGVIEYVLLAPAASLCALLVLLDVPRTSPGLTLPWVIAVPPGLALGWRATHPRVLERLERSDRRGAHWIAELLHGVEVLREVVLHPRERPGALPGMALYWAGEIACLGFALLCFSVTLPLAALVVAYATGYAASRRSLPLGGAGVTEALLTLALIAVHVEASHALFSVLAYRVVNFLVPTLPGLLAHSSLRPLIEGGEATGRDSERGPPRG
jgi:uncharacterized membrane protein YbhN (UPF0104 family)